jgi:hypothetical protein
MANLKDVIAERVSMALHLPVRIGELRFEMLASRFVGRDIEAGQRGVTFISVPNLVVGVSLLASSESLTLTHIAVDDAELDLPARWLEHPLEPQRVRPLTIGQAQLKLKHLGVRCEDNGQLSFEDLTVTLKGVTLLAPVKGKPLPLRGVFSFAAKSLTIADVALTDIAGQGTIKDGALLLSRFVARGLGGQVTLRGRIGLSGNRLGPVSFKGQVDLHPEEMPGSRLWGTLKLTGRSLTSLAVAVVLQARGAKLPQKGAAARAPALPLKGTVGGKTLKGTLADWRLM